MQAQDDDKLDEVKAILRRLQRIGTSDEEGAGAAAPERAPVTRDGSKREGTRHKIAASPIPVKNAPPAPEDSRRSSQLWKFAFVAVPALLLAIGLHSAFWPKTGGNPQLTSPPELSKAQPSPTATERQRATAAIPQSDQRSGAGSVIDPKAEPVSPASPQPLSDEDAERMSNAQRLIDEGKIVAGRDLLLDGLAERVADAALALARSYDPNSLRQISDADAPPDVEQAERWYRRWHEIAVSGGLALDAQRLDRIIKAMK